MIKVAIIGCGNIGYKRLKVIQKDKQSKIVAIVGKRKPNTSIDYLGEVISKKIKCHYTNKIQDALKPEIDVIILATQPNLFMRYGSKILKAKKHLLIEKPLGVNSDQANKLVQLARKNNVFLKTGFNLRYDDGIILFKKLLKKKIIGKIYFFKAEYVNGSVKTNKNKIGSLKDIGIHCINLFEYLISKDFKIVSNSSQKNEYFKDDNGFLTLKTKNILGTVHYSFVRWKNKFCLEISGSKGSIVIESLPKWGSQTITLFKRVFPSGTPKIKEWSFKQDNSWKNEWSFFKKKIKKKKFNLEDLNEGLVSMKNLKKILSK